MGATTRGPVLAKTPGNAAKRLPCGKPHLWLSLALLFLSPFLTPLPGSLCPDQFRVPGPHCPCSGTPLSPASPSREKVPLDTMTLPSPTCSFCPLRPRRPQPVSCSAAPLQLPREHSCLPQTGCRHLQLPAISTKHQLGAEDAGLVGPQRSSNCPVLPEQLKFIWKKSAPGNAPWEEPGPRDIPKAWGAWRKRAGGRGNTAGPCVLQEAHPERNWKQRDSCL